MKEKFKNLLFSEVGTQLGIKHSFSSPYRPQTNRCIESSYKSFKNCVRKFTINGGVEWDEAVHIACAAFNFFPNGQSHELAFSLVFGRDVYIPTLANLLQPKLYYLGCMSSLLSIEMLKRSLHASSNKSQKGER